MDTGNVAYSLGNHAARLDGIEQRLIEIENSQKEQTSMLATLVQRGERVKGGWAVVTVTAAFVSGVATLLVEWFKK